MKEEGAVHEACEWCYRGVWSVLTKWFCLPRKPDLVGFGEGHAVVVMRPSEAYLKYRKFLFWIGLVVIDVVLAIVWIALTIALPWVGILTAPLWLALIVLPDILAYIAIHLRYDTTWYALSDRSLRIRRGIWTVHETTITFANIQNVHVAQGPLQRWFGFSNLVVSTAGGGGTEAGATAGGHVGLLEGIENAHELRAQILRQSQFSAGLGDESVREERELEAAEGGDSRGVFAAGDWGGREVLELLKEIRDASVLCGQRLT